MQLKKKNYLPEGFFDQEHFVADFPPASPDDWQRAAEAALKGAPFEKSLVKKRLGTAVWPIYHQLSEISRKLLTNPGAFPYQRGRTQTPSWRVATQLATNEPDEWRTLTSEALTRGQQMITALFPTWRDDAAMSVALGDLPLETVPSLLGFSQDATARMTGLHHVLSSTGMAALAPGSVVGLAPANQLWCARDHGAVDNIFAELAAVRSLGAAMGQVQSHLVSALPGWRRGLGIIDKAGYVVVEILESLRRCDEGSHADVWKAMAILWPVGSALFEEVAAIRALRSVLALVGAELGISLPPPPIVATWSVREMTRFEPENNILRQVLSVLAGALAGVEVICTGPFDLGGGTSASFQARVSRNIQLVANAECALGTVQDPLGGSYFLEHMTELIARQVWQKMQAVEQAGGLGAVVVAGGLEEMASRERALTALSLARRKQVMVGVNQFVERKKIDGGPVFDEERLAFEYEQLQSQVVRREPPVRVSLLRVGPLKECKPRADFSAGFLGAGGFEVEESPLCETADEVIETAIKMGGEVAVFCASDERYPDFVAKTALGLKDVMPVILLAGRPGEFEKGWRESGVTDFIFIGQNQLNILKSIVDKLEIR